LFQKIPRLADAQKGKMEELKPRTMTADDLHTTCIRPAERAQKRLEPALMTLLIALALT
jgi:hypothetical protein